MYGLHTLILPSTGRKGKHLYSESPHKDSAPPSLKKQHNTVEKYTSVNSNNSAHKNDFDYYKLCCIKQCTN